MAVRPFPPDFIWGVAVAGHQNEGNNKNSDTWFLENVSPTVFREPSGLACNAWELWRQDLDLVAQMGLNAFRFSTEWARIEPSPGEFDEAALDHYEAMVDRCIELGLAPAITFSHFTSPHWFAERGGWLSGDAPSRFARFCDRVMQRIGDRIAIGVTLNEPDLPQMLSWSKLPAQVRALERATLEAASKAAGVERYRTGNVMVPEDFDRMRQGMTEAHIAARSAIKSRRPDLLVGLSLAMVDDQAVPGGEDLRDRKRAEVYDHWLNVAADDDFIGVQNYERIVYGSDGQVPSGTAAVMNQMGTAVEPASLGGAVRYAHRVSGRPVLVTEHGIATEDDGVRATFIEPSLAGLLDAMDDGVPVLGYFHWTLMDNFEWIFGYHSHLGLHAVDRQTFERTAKPSAAVYAAIARAGAVSA